MAALLRSRPRAFALLGSDSDFFVMQGVRYIPFKLLDMHPDGDLQARVYTPELVAASLGLPVDRLSDLASLCGNDTTDAFLDKHPLLADLGLATVSPRHKASPRCIPAVAAAFLAAFPHPLSEHPAVARLAQADSSFARALVESRDFYSVCSTPRPPRAAAPLEGVLREGLRACTLPSWALAVFLRKQVFLTCRMEPITGEESPIETVLRPLRSAIYALLGLGEVTEHVRKGSEQVSRPVPAMPTDTLQSIVGVPTLLELLEQDEYSRKEALALLLHASVDLQATVAAGGAPLPDVDPLFYLSNEIYLPNGVVMPFQPVALAMRYLVINHVMGQVISFPLVLRPSRVRAVVVLDVRLAALARIPRAKYALLSCHARRARAPTPLTLRAAEFTICPRSSASGLRRLAPGLA